LGLPLLAADQAQKHVTVNEGLLTVDGIVQCAIKERNRNDPPGTPADGDRYLVAAGASGAWLSHDGDVALREAGSDAIARQVLRDFVGRFGDGHMSLVFPDEVSEETLPWGTASICRGLGYEEETRPAGLPFERIGGRAIETPDSAVFPIHVLDLPAGKLGVLRIPSFYEWGYYQFCPQAVAEVGLPEDGECNEECGAAIGQKAAELLTMAVARQIERLKAEGVAALAVDITQNGGGSLWLDPVARMLTPVKLKAPRLAFTRTEGWRQTFADNLGLIDGDLANPSLSTEDRAALEAARAATQTAMDEAAKGCDRSGLWVGQATHCSLLGPAMFYATGTLDYAPPGAFASLAAAPALFFSALYLYQEGLWQGPLYVLMDEGSAFFVTGGGLALEPWPPASALASAKAALRNMVHAAAKELPDLRVAMITIMGVIKEGTELSPSEISRYFLALLEERDPAVETVLPVR
jgi:NAD(P)-dependent dehydrogenase (short-subunit alcohol dehydrogenase family)